MRHISCRNTRCCCSVAKSRLTLCDPMACSIPGSSVLHYLRSHNTTTHQRIPCSLSPGSGHVISHHLQKEIQNTSDHTQVICKGWNHPEPLRVLRTARLSTAGALGVLFLLPGMPSFSPSLLSFSCAGDIVYTRTN